MPAEQYMASEAGRQKLRAALVLIDRHEGNMAAAAREAGVCRSTMQHRVAQAQKFRLELDESPFKTPEFPNSDIPTEEIIDGLVKRFEQRHIHEKAKRWFPVKVNISGPFGIVWYGDVHIDSNGCNWPLLMSHIALHKKCPQLLAAGLGDYRDNWPWTGRLVRLYAESDQSQATAKKLVKWFLLESDIPWFLWILGNHDLWNDGASLLEEMNTNRIVMERRAQFVLQCPNGREYRIWVEHDFKGHSMWNSLHGPQKAAHMKEMAHLYICGDKHNWALHQEESASKGFVYWLARARGYKYIDDYAEGLGHFPQREGASIVSIHDPDATTMAGALQCFSDPEEATDYLIWKRKCTTN